MRARSTLTWLGLALAAFIAVSSTRALAQTPEVAPAPPPYGYPPPAYPPPGYAPGYAPGYPPGYYPPPTLAPAPAVPGYRTGFLGMPYIGIHIPTGDAGDYFDAGFRMGAILGGRIIPMLSLNGEITIDIMNPQGVPSGVDVTLVMADLLFSPLLHFGTDSVEVFFGPKLGAFGMAESASYQGQSVEASAQGLAYGLNVGVAIPVGNIAIGGIISYVGRHATKTCMTLPGESEECDTDPEGDDFKTLSILGTVMF